jgi:hypothetical protein
MRWKKAFLIAAHFTEIAVKDAIGCASTGLMSLHVQKGYVVQNVTWEQWENIRCGS